jgi:T5SS/PEP-CTERM-associated repeat protein
MLVAGQTDNARPSTGTVSISNGGTFTATFDSGPTGVLPGNPAVGIGRGLGSTGIVNVDGTGSQLIAANGMFSIGRLGSGALNVTNGGQVVAGGTVFGSTVGPTGSSSILVDGTGSKLNAGSNDILLGINNDLNPANTNHGTATLNVRNGGEVTGNVTLGQGGTLRGNGTVTGNVLNQGGTIQPGNSPGTLHVLGNYTQNKGIIEIEVAGASAFDVLDVSMDVALDDVLIRFIFTGGYSPLAGDTYEFLKSGTGSISNLNPLYEVFGLQPGFDYTVGGGQNGLTLVAINNGVAVPEPGSLALLAIAFLGLVSVRGRTRT